MLAQLVLLVAPLLLPAFLSLALWKGDPSAGPARPASERADVTQSARPAAANPSGAAHGGCSGQAVSVPARGGVIHGLHTA